MQNDSRKTLLHSWHISQHASMADFGGYNMPLWYSSSRREHLAVLTTAGVFDTSHMGVLAITGPAARKLLQTCFTNDLEGCLRPGRKPLFEGRCVYGAFLNPQGGVIDDAIVMQTAAAAYLVVINAGMGAIVTAHLAANQPSGGVQITDLSDQVGKMDVQGPYALRVVSKIIANPSKALDNLPYFTFKGFWDTTLPQHQTGAITLLDGTPLLLSRTGYTGELGVELFIESAHLVRLWEMVLEAGLEHDVVPCGLAARDSLRTGAVLPLSHQDIGDWPFINHPWHVALPFSPDGHSFTKRFMGDQALLSISQPEYTYPFAGHDLRKVSLPATVLDTGGTPVGTVLTCVTDMGIGRHAERIYSVASPDIPSELQIKGLCCGFVKVNRKMQPGDTIILKDTRREIPARIERDLRPDRTARQSVSPDGTLLSNIR